MTRDQEWKYWMSGLKVSELILGLQMLQEKHGDVPVCIIAGGGSDDRYPAKQAWGPNEPGPIIYLDAY